MLEKQPIRYCLVVLLMVGASFAAYGQNTVTGAFQGDVWNKRTGTPLAGVVIQIVSVRTGIVKTRTTDSKGRFYQNLLEPGLYNITVVVPGFKARTIQREIRNSITGDVVPVPVALDPETTPSGLPATPEPPDDIRVDINTTDARRIGSTKDREVTALPVGASTVTRSFDEFAQLQPGVAPPPQTIGDVAGPGVGPGVGSAGQFAVNGIRSRANNFTVDGSDNNDEDIGVRRQGFVALIPQPLESIEEVSIITLLAPAQYGRNIGAQVNALSKSGGNISHGTISGAFNSHQLNARNFFDTTNGTDVFPLKTSAGQTALLDGQPITVRNQSSGEDPFTYGQIGGTIGGAFVQKKLFYFVSGEYQKINASQEKNFAVPTVEQRGAFGSGATGTSVNYFTNARLANPLYPTNEYGDAVFSLIPFGNNPTGVYGANTLTQVLPSSGHGAIVSGRLDDNFRLRGRQHTFTARYNFTDDKRYIPAVNEAIFSTVLSKIRTHNLSLYLNTNGGDDEKSNAKHAESGHQFFNQIRFSFGRTRLNFEDARATGFLLPSDELATTPFLLNAPLLYNTSLPSLNGQPRFVRIFPGEQTTGTTEDILGPLGEIAIGGFSNVGVDVYNFPQTRENKTYQLADEFTARRGSHSFVFGADTRRTDLDSDLPRLARTLMTFNGAPRLTAKTGASCPNGGVANFCFLAPGDPGSILKPQDIAGLGVASNSILNFNVDRPDSKANLRYYQFDFYAQDTWRASQNLSLSFGLRYEYNTPIKEINGLIEKTFSDPRLDAVPELKRLINGRTQLYRPDRNNFGPRVGIAYSKDMLGKNRVSVFRAGYGIYYDQILGAVANQSRNVFPTFLTFNFNGLRDFGNQTLYIQNPATFPVDGGFRVPGTLNQFHLPAGDTFQRFVVSVSDLFSNAVTVTLPTERLDTPMAHHFSFIFEQQLNKNFSVSAGYVGTAGRHLLRFTTPNLGSSLASVPLDIARGVFSPVNDPYSSGLIYIPARPLDPGTPGTVPVLGTVNQFETTASSRYDSLQTQLHGRFLNALNFQVSYTLSKVNDDVSDVFDLAGAFVLPQDSFDLRAERGPANFDVRHRVAYDLIYNFGPKAGRGLLRHFTDNLQIATTGRFHTGQPFTVNSVIDVNLDGNLTDRLNTTSGIEVTGDRSRPLRLTTTNLGSLLAPFGTDGKVGRNTFRAGSVLEMDVSVIKPFTFGTKRLLFRTDIFNFINRSNFGVPVRLLEAPGFGKATSTVTPGRRVQFSLKYEF